MTLRSPYLPALAFSVLVGWAPVADASGQHHKYKTTQPGAPGSFAKSYQVDEEVKRRMHENAQGTSSVIVSLAPGAQLPSHFQRFVKGSRLDIINGQVLENLPNGLLKQLSKDPSVLQIHDNRSTDTLNYRTAVTVGARAVQETFGYTGSGIGVAVLDSGIATFHDDLTVGYSSPLFPYGNQRVRKFVDFVNGQTLPYDDNGHGTHVAGTI